MKTKKEILKSLKDDDILLEIVEIDDYILAVSDEEIEEGEKDFFIIANDRDKSWINRLEKVIECKVDPKQGKVLILSTGFIYIDEGCKLIAYQSKNNTLELDLPLLPEIIIDIYNEEDLLNAFFNGWIYRGEGNYQYPKAKEDFLKNLKKSKIPTHFLLKKIEDNKCIGEYIFD